MRSPSLASLRTSILAAIGLTACGGSVAVTNGSGGDGGNGGNATTTSNTVGTSSGGGAQPECAGATPVITADGQLSGFSRCPDGTVHRVEPVTCNVEIGITACTGTEMTFDCKSDADCTAAPHGRCASVSYFDFGGETTACSCTYPCADDGECGAGNVCVCGGVVPEFGASFCAAATCATGDACPSGECGLSAYPNGCYTEVTLACRNPNDACRTDAECAATTPNTKCVQDTATASWACLGTNCAIGRPLLVEGEARTANTVERDDWTASGIALCPGDLSAAAREQVAAHWLQVAALEHASVASFARFTLELLALGAPARLLADAHQSALDEVEHARLAYAVASAYGGRTYGPDALDLTAVALRTDVRAVLRSLIAEGCVGETLGVAEALDLCARADDPALQRVHARIAADEQRHAELAWRTLAWLLADADADTRSFAARCFEEATAAASRDPDARPLVLPQHGLLAAETIGAVRRRALADVIAPCAAALLGEHSSESAARTSCDSPSRGPVEIAAAVA